MRAAHEGTDEIGLAVAATTFSIVAVFVPVAFMEGIAGQVQVLGPDVQRLQALAERVAAVMRRVPGAVDVDLSTAGQKPELDVQVNRALASSLGVSVGDIAQALRIAFAGVDAGDWIDPTGETRDVMVRLAPAARTRAADLAQPPLVLPPRGNDQPRMVPLEQVAVVRTGTGPSQIQHLDGDPVVTVGANVTDRSVGEVSNAINARLGAIDLPPGYRITQGGEVEDQQEVFGRIFAALGLAILLMYLVLVAQFGSFIDPLAVLLSLPLSLIGVVLALLITGDTLNIMSLIGVILLMGVVAKNAILLLDFAKWSREQGMPRREAIVEAGRIRLRPILMTTVALIAGMMPVASGIGEGADLSARPSAGRSSAAC